MRVGVLTVFGAFIVSFQLSILPAFANKGCEQLQREIMSEEKNLEQLDPEIQKASDHLDHLMSMVHQISSKTKEKQKSLREQKRVLEEAMQGQLSLLRDLALRSDSVRASINQKLATLQQTDLKKKSLALQCQLVANAERVPLKVKALDFMGRILGYRISSRHESKNSLSGEKEKIYQEMLKDLEKFIPEIDGVAPSRSKASEVRAKIFCTGRTKSEYIRSQIEGFRAHDLYLEAHAHIPGLILENKTGFMSHPSKNASAVEHRIIRDAPSTLLSQYQGAKESKRVLEFFKDAFDHSKTCLEGRVGALDRYYMANLLMKDSVEVEPTVEWDEKKTDEALLYDYLSVFVEKQKIDFIKSQPEYLSIYNEKFKQRRIEPDWDDFLKKLDTDPRFTLSKTQNEFRMFISDQRLVGRKAMQRDKAQAPSPITQERLEEALEKVISVMGMSGYFADIE